MNEAEAIKLLIGAQDNALTALDKLVSEVRKLTERQEASEAKLIELERKLNTDPYSTDYYNPDETPLMREKYRQGIIPKE